MGAYWVPRPLPLSPADSIHCCRRVDHRHRSVSPCVYVDSYYDCSVRRRVSYTDRGGSPVIDQTVGDVAGAAKL